VRKWKRVASARLHHFFSWLSDVPMRPGSSDFFACYGWPLSSPKLSFSFSGTEKSNPPPSPGLFTSKSKEELALVLQGVRGDLSRYKTCRGPQGASWHDVINGPEI